MEIDDCKPNIQKRKPGEPKYFDENDKRFFDNPFAICVNGGKKNGKGF